MTIKQVVLDSCVFSKLFLVEEDRDAAIGFLKELGNQDYVLLAPQLFFFEVMAVVSYAKLDVNHVLNVIDAYRKTNLQLIEPTSEMLGTAAAITDQGHPKSGYPSIYDSVYHAMALCLHCPFVTADKRHYEKTKQLGNIVLLSDWQRVLS